MSEPNFRRDQSYLSVVPAQDAFSMSPVRILDPTKIEPRDWIYGTHLIRGFVTLMVAAGGTGKSSLILALCLAIATGRPLFSVKIHNVCKTGLLNLEDPQDEIDRRLSALGKYYNINDSDLAGRFLMSPADHPIRIAAVSQDGFDVVHPDEQAIIQRVRDEQIGVLAVDPFAESHTLEENSNPQMVLAAAAWRRVARMGNCAVLLAHHVRKGVVDSIEAARGAKALTDSARIGLLLSTMTEKEAEDLGIEAENRHAYVRMDDAKANLAPRATKASWFHLNTVALNNGNDKHPNGDSVGVIERWAPTTPFEDTTNVDLNLVLDRIRDGLPNGDRYTSRKQSKDRWAGQIIVDLLGKSVGHAAEILKTWLAHGVLIEEQQRTSARNSRWCLQVVEANRPGYTIVR